MKDREAQFIRFIQRQMTEIGKGGLPVLLRKVRAFLMMAPAAFTVLVVRALATLLVHQRARNGGRAAPRQIAWINSGVCICNPRFLEFIPPGVSCDLPHDIFPNLITDGEMFAYPLAGYRCAINSPERYAQAQSAIAEGRCRITLAVKRLKSGHAVMRHLLFRWLHDQ